LSTARHGRPDDGREGWELYRTVCLLVAVLVAIGPPSVVAVAWLALCNIDDP
jgi:hypothetical protein